VQCWSCHPKQDVLSTAPIAYHSSAYSNDIRGSITQRHQRIYFVLARCEEGEHNDLATLFLSSSHHTIIKLFSMGHDPGEPYVTHFTQGSLALFVVIYLILMSVGAGVAIPGGLFMPSLIVSQACDGILLV
jgi:hypothetical protein